MVRRILVTLLLAMAGLLLPLGVVADWAHATIYDSSTFSDRTTSILDSQAVRQELASRLTEQLALAGYPQAVNFRPALQLAIEAAIDTDTFRAIFRTSLRRTHAAVLAGNAGGGLNLGDSASVLTSTAALSGNSSSQAAPNSDLGDSLGGTVKRLGNWGIWDLDSTISSVTLGCFVGAAVSAGGAIAIGTRRRRVAHQLGLILVVDGGALFLALLVGQWYLERLVHDPQLSTAVGDAVWHGTSDLRDIALWVAGYGLIVAAAASSGPRWTPRAVGDAAQTWVRRRRTSQAGSILLGVGALALGVVVVQDPRAALEFFAVIAGLWLSYLGLGELLRLFRDAPVRRPRVAWRGVAVVGVAVVVMVAVVTTGLTVSTRRSAAKADASGRLLCNGSAALCDLRLDQVIFPGTHNSMSSSLYPGYLFGEQIQTIKGQLDAGIRALLIDTHYGVPSTLRLPGSESPLILTDRAAEKQTPAEQATDPGAAQRAATLAARAPRAAGATRDIYLCHNYCELGAVPFSSVLDDLKTFLDTHPDAVVMTIIQDATTPADTAAAFDAVGLSNRVATLQPGQPLPTLGSLVTSGHNLVVFPEQGGPGAPAWYQPAYNWFQETPFTFRSASDFNCRPNRGTAGNPLMLINQWVTQSPPNPSVAARVNSDAALNQRIQSCIAQRGVLPNVVAVDFSEKGNLVSTLRKINLAKVGEVKGKPPPHPAGNTSAPAPAAAPPAPTVTAAPLPTVPPSSQIPSLTGGDPGTFCTLLPTVVRSLTAWADDVLSDPPAQAGVTDLAYGPVLARDFQTYVDSAPIELADRARGLLALANSAVTTLKGLGLSNASVAHLADQASQALGAPGNADGITVGDDLTRQLEAQVAQARLVQAGIVFSASRPDPTSDLDLGYVPDSVATNSPFSSCPSISANI